jgi:hypothetical protein
VRSDLTAAEAAELEQRRQNWAAIDSLVREFIPEAIRRVTQTKGRFFKHWLVQPSQSKVDDKSMHLFIRQNGTPDGLRALWDLRCVNKDGYIEILAWSGGPYEKGPWETNVVDGLREGALRSLNDRSVRP